MTEAKVISNQPQRGTWPATARDRLLASVLDSVDALSGIGTVSAPCGPVVADENSRALLRVLTYSYATGVLASDDIESALNKDPLLRYLSGGERHESGSLRLFRRRNRLTVQRCLAHALERCWAADREETPLSPWAPSGYARASLDRWGAGIGAPDFEEEAASRIQQAVRSDAELLDE